MSTMLMFYYGWVLIRLLCGDMVRTLFFVGENNAVGQIVTGVSEGMKGAMPFLQMFENLL